MTPIHELALAYGQAFESGDVEQIMPLVTDDFVALTPDKPPLVGREAVRKEIEADLNAMKVLKLQFNHEEVVIEGDLAYAWGMSIGEVIVGQEEESIEINGKYLWIVRRQDDGSWKLARDSANGD